MSSRFEERTQRQERAVEVAVRPLDLTLGLGVAGAERHDLRTELPEERRDLIVQDRHPSSAPTNDRGVVVALDLLGDPTEPLEAPGAFGSASSIAAI
jgi:hypothetical protein